jgi:hypothetical protein
MPCQHPCFMSGRHSFHVSQQRWSMADGWVGRIEEMFSIVIGDRRMLMDRWSIIIQSGREFHSLTNIIDGNDRWLGRPVWSRVQISHRGVGLMVDGRVNSSRKVLFASKENVDHRWLMYITSTVHIASYLRSTMQIALRKNCSLVSKKKKN